MPSRTHLDSNLRHRLRLIVGAVLGLSIALTAPTGAHASSGLTMTPNFWAYNWNTYTGSEGVWVANNDPTPVTVAVGATSPTGPSASSAPAITADASGCTAQLAQGDRCLVIYSADLTGAVPGTSFPYEGSINGQSFQITLTVPMPPVDVATGDGSIDFSTGDTSADGSYDSDFAPAHVTVTKTTGTGATRTVRHLQITDFGKHPWLWHGRNDADERVKAGTYRLTVIVGGVRHTRKVIVR